MARFSSSGAFDSTSRLEEAELTVERASSNAGGGAEVLAQPAAISATAMRDRTGLKFKPRFRVIDFIFMGIPCMFVAFD